MSFYSQSVLVITQGVLFSQSVLIITPGVLFSQSVLVITPGVLFSQSVLKITPGVLVLAVSQLVRPEIEQTLCESKEGRQADRQAGRQRQTGSLDFKFLHESPKSNIAKVQGTSQVSKCSQVSVKCQSKCQVFSC